MSCSVILVRRLDPGSIFFVGEGGSSVNRFSSLSSPSERSFGAPNSLELRSDWESEIAIGEDVALYADCIANLPGKKVTVSI